MSSNHSSGYCVSADSIDALVRSKARQRAPEFRATLPPKWQVVAASARASEPAFAHREAWAAFKPRHVHAATHQLHVMHFAGIAAGLGGRAYARYECGSCALVRHVARDATTGEQVTTWEGAESWRQAQQ